MKKFATLLLCLVMVLALAACSVSVSGTGSNGTSDDGQPGSVENQPPSGGSQTPTDPVTQPPADDKQGGETDPGTQPGEGTETPDDAQPGGEEVDDPAGGEDVDPPAGTDVPDDSQPSGGSGGETTQPTDPPAEPGPQELTAEQAKTLAEQYIDQPVSALIAAIGQPISSDYAPSCLGEGEDGNLYYDGFTVYTYRDGDSEVIQYVE